MCGRYASARSRIELLEEFAVERDRVDEPLQPDYNVAPTKPVYAVMTRMPRAEEPPARPPAPVRELRVVRWGLVPSWAKALSVGDRMINARADRLLTSNAFKRAFERRRCIVPADGFYEWQVVEGRKQKQPWFFRRRDGEPIAFAGLWEIWHDPEVGDDAPRIRSCTIITTDPNDMMRPIHDRMPVILPESAWDTWLDRDNHDVKSLTKLLVPARDAELELWPVTTQVNKASENSAALIEPAPVDSP